MMQMADNGDMAQTLKAKDARITIRLTSVLREHLEAEAEVEGRSLANLITRVLQAHVDTATKKGGRRRG